MKSIATTPSHIATTVLLTLALARMAGDVLGVAWLEGAAAATCASPAPRVFSAVHGLETYSTRFHLLWHNDERLVQIEIGPEIAARLAGPYNRRNVYGAVLAYGPLLATNPKTKSMYESVMRRALCAPWPLLAELGFDTSRVRGNVSVRYEPLRAGALGDLPLVLEVRGP